MKKFEELKNGTIFSVAVWEIKPSFSSEEFLSKYVFNAYIQGQNFSFMKTGVDTCKELKSGTEFNLVEKVLMVNDETGLHFFGSYVNDKTIKNVADENFTMKYFEAAKKLNDHSKKLIKK